jgi:hypothetical protein
MWGWFKRLFQNQQARAFLLRMIAEDAAALVVALNPKAPWAQLLAAVVQQVATAAGTPTQNQAAIERAAAAALVRMGKLPEVKAGASR